MDKKACMKWTMFVSFVVLLVGGLNYLLMGILEFNLFGEIFGYDTVAGRVIYLIFGLAAVILAVTVISKANMKKQSGTSTPKKTN